jgi:hypothetical protein
VAEQRLWLEVAAERASPDVVILVLSPWSLRTDSPEDPTDPTLGEKLARGFIGAVSWPAARSAVVDRARRRLLHVVAPFTHWLPTSDAAWHLRPLLEARPEFELRFKGAATYVEEMVGRVRARNLTPLLVLVPLDVQTSASRNRLYAAERLPYPSWGFVDRDYTQDRRYADDMARLARELGVPLIDVTERLVTHASESYLQNDYHLSAAGHRRVAEEIAAPARDACQQAAVASK